ncbi:MAG: hypothetical protein JW804_07210 [Sedimentisphaerales bacterium]|nr:hypothetical protein [Sedimentisphaerales bacterium]
MVRYILLVLLLLLPANAADDISQKEAKKPLLRDGFVLMGVDGKVFARADKWYFELQEDVSDGRAAIRKGTKLQMLESAGLEKMLTYISDKPQSSFRLYNAMIATYQGQNFIFCDYFVPIAEQTEPAKTEKPGSKDVETEIPINEPNDTVVIPQEIIDKLSTRRIIQPQQLKQGIELKQDSILAGRCGFIEKSGDKWLFMFDSLGRNKAKASLELLPCHALERAQRKQAEEPEKIRFRISGIVTKYKGKYYLLLQRVTPAYNYGNFGS